MRIPKFAYCRKCNKTVNHVVETTNQGHVINGELYTWDRLLKHALPKSDRFAWKGFPIPPHNCTQEFGK